MGMDICVVPDEDDADVEKEMIAHGRHWKLFYFPNEQAIQYVVDKPVCTWTVHEVSLWVKACSDHKFESYAPYFVAYGVDGNHLLNITRSEMKNCLKMISPNVRRLFFEELRAISCLEKCSIRKQRKQSVDFRDIHRLSLRMAQ